jgi:hypothetical protein
MMSVEESEFAAGQGGHINQVSREGPASAAPALPEPEITRWQNIDWVDHKDYAALRAAYERVLTQRDEENVRAIRAEKGWDEAINRAEAAEAALAQANADTERYQWLRSKAARSLMTSKKHAGEIQVIQWEDQTEANVLKLEQLDAAIDEAIRRARDAK